MNETRQTTTISLPAEQMEFIKRNSDNVSKFMQELITKKMESFNPFNYNTSYQNTARTLAEQSINLINEYLNGIRGDAEESRHANMSADAGGYHISLKQEVPTGPSTFNTLCSYFDINKSDETLRFHTAVKKQIFGECMFELTIGKGDELYTKFMKLLSKYLDTVSNNI